jgi:putative nucleotidyltransferase with HDIG domain
MDGRTVNVTPQRVHVAVCLAQLDDILGAHATWPPPVVEPLQMRHSGATAPDTFVLAADHLHLAWRAANRYLYRIVDESFPGGWEELTLRAEADRTEAVLTAGFMAPHGSDHRRLRLRLEQALRTQLLQLISVAEAHADPAVNVRQLLTAVAQQEEIEWGHAGHSRGVERIAVALAEAILLPPYQIAYVQQAAQLHDIGKIALDSSLWARRGVLLASQRSALEPHAVLGARHASRVGLPEPVATAIRHHHEQWNGQGYPGQLAGEAIPLKARMLFLAEAVDSMLRPSYRRASLTTPEVLARLTAGADRLWDPRLTYLVMRLIDDRRHPLQRKKVGTHAGDRQPDAAQAGAPIK